MRGRSAPAALFLLAGAGLALAAPARPPIGAAPVSRATVDPQPPMALEVTMTALEKHARGGIATLLLRVTAEVPVEGAEVTAKLPGDLRFADGSREKTWKVDLAAGGARAIPVEVLVPRDGRFSIAADLEGSVHGRAIRRGAAGTLLVGKREAPPTSREGAIEYAAIEVESGTGEVQP